MTKKTPTIILFLCITLFTSGQDKEDSYRVYFSQGNTKTEIFYEDTLLILKPEEFKIIVELNNLLGIYAHISFSPEYYNTPENGEMDGNEYIGYKVMAEENFNEDQNIIVDNEYFSYWFYDPSKDWHRFDREVEVKGNKAICTMTVNRFSTRETKEDILPGEMEKTIYFLFFMENNQRKSSLKYVDKKRIKIKMAYTE